MRSTVAIIGAGLSGLYAALLLQRQHVDYVLLEARNAPGGRILSIAPALGEASASTGPLDSANRFDLGPTWFWPDMQHELDALVLELGLTRFAQHEAGDMMLEYGSHQPPKRSRGYVNSPVSMRLTGGMGSLVDALYQRLDPSRILLGHAVQHVRRANDHIEVISRSGNGSTHTLNTQRVLLAVPPRLVASSIEFTPALPSPLASDWRQVGTWMAPHAKYVAVYDAPFWREDGLSGEARSMRGALGEIHDASMPDGGHALFGFFAIPASVRQGVSEDVLKHHCRSQLARLFGPLAATPQNDFIKDWALDPLTATAADRDSPGHHLATPASTVRTGPWSGRLTGISSEWSRQFPGYLAGAVEAARLGVEALHLPDRAG